MEITEVKIDKKFNDDSKLKAYASITIDKAIAIHGIKVLEGDSGLFIGMPSRKTPSGENKDIVHPISKDVRTEFEEKIFKAYKEYKETEE